MEENRFLRRSRLFFALTAVFFLSGFISVSAATRTWDGGGADNNWSNRFNWSSDAVPTSADDVVFDGTSTKNSVMDSAGLTIKSLNASSTYAGILSIANGNTLTATGNWTYNAANFDAGTSTLKFGCSVTTFTPGTVNYYNLELAKATGCGNLGISGTATTTNNLTISDGNMTVNSGNINVQGNIYMTASSFNGGTAIITLNGSGNQTILASNTGKLPVMVVNKPSGTLYLNGSINLQSSWTHTAGTIDAGTSTLRFSGGATQYFTGGTETYNTIEFAKAYGAGNLSISGTATTTNFTVTVNTNGTVIGSTLNIIGDINMTASSFNGGGATNVFNIDGAGSQTFFSAGGYLPNITVNKPTGSLYLQGTIPLSMNWTYTAGTIDAGTSTLKFVGGTNQTFTPGTINYYNLEMAKPTGTGSLTVSGTATTTNNFIHSAGTNSTLNTGTVNVGGNVVITVTSGLGGTATINMNGSGTQSISSSGAKLPTLTINKSTGQVTIDSNLEVEDNLNVTTGELRHSAYTLQISGAATISSGGTFSDYATASSTIKFGSTVTNNGTINFNGGGTNCGNFDYVLLRSTTDGTQRSWSGTGTFNMCDVDMKDTGATSAAITVRSSTNSGNNGGSWTFNSNCLPSASFDDDFSSWSSGNATVNYKLIDPNSDTSNISQSANSGAEYSTDGSTWTDATQGTGGDGMTGLSSSASPGTSHSFIWNSSTDLPTTEDSSVYLRLRPNDGTENASGWATSSAFALDNVAPSSVGVPTFGTITTSSIVVNKPTAVTESGSGLYQWQARRGGATALGLNSTTTGSVTDSSLSANTQYSYDAQFKDYADNSSSYGTSASVYTLAPTPANLAASNVARTSMTLSVDALDNQTSGSSGYYFVNETASTTSGWIQTNSWDDSGLTCGTSYSYTVKYRNGDGTETSDATLTQATSACPSAETTRVSYAISPPRVYDAPPAKIQDKKPAVYNDALSRDKTAQATARAGQAAEIRAQIRQLQSRLIELYRLLIQVLTERMKERGGAGFIYPTALI